MTALDLVTGGVVEPWQAALLWTEVERGGSVCIAAGPSGAGKTTTLTALFDAIHPRKRWIFVRGMYETFAFRRETRAEDGVLLVNEISAHLPIYCWGDAVRGVLQSARDGYQVLATIHALSPEEVVQQLAARPLRVPMPLIAELGLVAIVDASRALDGSIRRRVGEIVRLRYSEAKAAVTLEVVTGAGDEAVRLRAAAFDRFAGEIERPSGQELRSRLAELRGAGDISPEIQDDVP